MSLILASTSPIRRKLLAQAGLSFSVMAPPVDEEKLKAGATGLAPGALAQMLAAEKALAVAATEPRSWVIGADQVLDLDGAILNKPRSLVEAAAHLTRLQGKTHVLVTATVCAHEGAIAWRHLGSVAMTMRELSEKDIETYLAAIGEDALTSVGAYKIEGRGIRLFEAIAGDYFTVLGLSLLPLLNFLRTVNEVEP